MKKNGIGVPDDVAGRNSACFLCVGRRKDSTLLQSDSQNQCKFGN